MGLRWLALVVLVAALGTALSVRAAGAPAHVIGCVDADGWMLYGANRRIASDLEAPGHVAIVVAPPHDAAAPWKSGASRTIEAPLRAGEPVTVVTWVRVSQGQKIIAVFAANAPPYTNFGRTELDGTGRWTRLVLSGVAPADVAAGSHAVVLQLGMAGEASLGPAFILAGSPSEQEIARLERTYVPKHTVEELTFTSADGTILAATVRRPVGRSPSPAVVTIGGSGLYERGGFALLHDRLLARGIATFEYDKRGAGKSGGERTESVPVLAQDVAAAARFLASRPGIDPHRLALLGHSQGGLVVAQAADGPARDLGLRAIVGVGAPALPGDQLVSDQLAHQLHLGWPQGGSYEDQLRFANQLVSLVQSTTDMPLLRSRIQAEMELAKREGRIPPDAVAQLEDAFTDPQMRTSVLAYRPAEVLKRLKLPVLLIYGAQDVLVSATQNAPIARAALIRNPGAQVVQLPGLNHGMAQTRGPDDWSNNGVGFSAPAAQDVIVSWLVRQLNAAAPRSAR